MHRIPFAAAMLFAIAAPAPLAAACCVVVNGVFECCDAPVPGRGGGTTTSEADELLILQSRIEELTSTVEALKTLEAQNPQ